MASSSSSSPATTRLHDNLMELYTNGVSPQRRHPATRKHRPPQQKPNDSNASLSSSSMNSTTKKRRNRKFLPLMSQSRNSCSSSDEDIEGSWNGGEGGLLNGVAQKSNGACVGKMKHQQSRQEDEQQSIKGPLHLNDNAISTETPFQSALGQRIFCKYQQQLQSLPNCQPQQFKVPSQLPPNFLRLPSNLVQISSGWVDIKKVRQTILQSHFNHENTMSESPLMHDENRTTQQCQTGIIHAKHPQIGLGMSLREYDGCIYVQAVLRNDGKRIDDFTINIDDGGPAYIAGMRPGDRLMGVNSSPFLRERCVSSVDENMSIEGTSSSDQILKSVGDAISRASAPLVIHFQRERSERILSLIRQDATISTTRQTNMDTAGITKQQSTSIRQNGYHIESSTLQSKPAGPYIHPFAKALSKRSIIQPSQERIITQQLHVLTDRTRQWESKLSFRLRSSDYKLRPMLDPRDVEPTYYASFFTSGDDIPPFFSYRWAKSVRAYAPSTPMIEDWRAMRECEGVSPVRPPRHTSREAAVLADLYAGLDQDDADVQDLFLGERSSFSNGETMRRGGGVAYPRSERYFASAGREHASDIVVPLVGVRKAICVRILNTFLDSRNRAAFSIWCYDVETGMEWWAPVRYHEDFRDLRSALISIDKSISEIPFPNLKWAGFGLAVSDAKESANSRELRRDQLETFLRRVIADVYRGPLHPYLAEIATHLQSFVGCDGVLSDDNSLSLALNHQVAISESTYGKRSPDEKSEPDRVARMHLKRSVQRYVYRIFLLPCIEKLVSQYVDATKQNMNTESTAVAGQTQNHKMTSSDVEKIRDFTDQMQGLILDGCVNDLTSISQRRDFAAINDFSNIDELLREAIREQIELEVYVPLRTTISKFLVCMFYNEDMEMKHKMKALENKEQSFFRIHPEHRSRSDWKSVSHILQEGVGRSTLPSVKLRAIVDAAKEITALHSEERGCFEETSFFDGPIQTKTLGADDFLPIFIFCFVRAKLEKPCALCELLQTMCDPLKLNGETGYYLASFHAAMTHINELDLTEANDELSIFLDKIE